VSDVTYTRSLTADEWTRIRGALLTEAASLRRSRRRCKSPHARELRTYQHAQVMDLLNKLSPPKAPAEPPLGIVEVSDAQ
jgi:hypothetical protein